MTTKKTLILGLTLFLACPVGRALADYVADLDESMAEWNSVYGTNVVITGWTELGIIATGAERDATVSEMTDPTQVYVVEGDVTDPPTITAVLMEGAPQELLDEWAAIVDGIVAIGQHKIEIGWQFVETKETFTTITVANDDAVDGIKFDSMLSTIVIIGGEGVASGGRIITWIWGSTRGEIDWEVTCHAHPPVCSHDCSAWMTLGDAQIECMEEIVGNNCKLHYGWAWRTPTGSITIVWNPGTLQFDVTVTGLGSSGKGDGSIIDPCPKGSCCVPDGGCEDGMGWDTCEDIGGTYQGDGTVCGEVDCAAPIPTVSEWGLIVMTLLALTAGTIVFGRRRKAAVA